MKRYTKRGHSQAERDAIRWRNRVKTLGEVVREINAKSRLLTRSLEAIEPHADKIQNPILAASFAAKLDELLALLYEIRARMNRPAHLDPRVIEGVSYKKL